MGVLGGHSLLLWGVFTAVILALLAVDLGVAHRRAHPVSFVEAVVWNVVWTAMGLAFAALVLWRFGATAGIEYVTGYVLERALSIDNIFVFVIVFRYFAVPADYQHRILYWGILGALVMRGVLILAGAAAVSRFEWVLYLFGAFLVWTGVHMVFKKDEEVHPERNPVVRLAARVFPVLPRIVGPRFFVRHEGRVHATPLLIVLLVIETSDLIFAFDSIPAIFGVTRDPFIIYTSNIFAILGLRAMYFLLATILPRFRFLKHGLSLILVFIGVRMLVGHFVEIPIALALAAVVGILAVSIAASFLPERRDRGAAD